MSDFVIPEPHRLTLADGQFVDIKKRLNVGEREDMFARMSPHGGVINRREVRTAKVLTYLLGWSLTNGETPVLMSPDLPEQTRLDTIRSLDPDRFDEIYDAIDAYETAEDAARAAQKKTRASTRAGDPILPSPSAVTGASSGSVN